MTTALTTGTPHVLYRFFAADDTLLYIGLTVNPGTRWTAHSKDKPWWLDVAKVTVEHYPSREAVEAAEIAAIKAERPLHNVAHNRPAKPKRQPRLARPSLPTPTRQAAPLIARQIPARKLVAPPPLVKLPRHPVAWHERNWSFPQEMLDWSTRIINSGDKRAAWFENMLHKQLPYAVVHRQGRAWNVEVDLCAVVPGGFPDEPFSPLSSLLITEHRMGHGGTGRHGVYLLGFRTSREAQVVGSIVVAYGNGDPAPFNAVLSALEEDYERRVGRPSRHRALVAA